MHTEFIILKLLNRAQKKLSATEAWENSQKASVEAELKKIEVGILYSFCRREFQPYIHFLRIHIVISIFCENRGEKNKYDLVNVTIPTFWFPILCFPFLN